MSRIVITGASSGLGAAISEALNRDGHSVYGFSLPDHDVRDFEDCKDFLAHVCKFKDSGERKIEVLINCAGISPLSWIEYATDGEWDDTFGVNCKGVFNMTRAALHYLSAKPDFGRRYQPFGGGEGGTILNIISTAAFNPMTCSHIYNASKAALLMMTRQMARELKPRHDIDVIGICPNKIEGTEMTKYVEAAVPGLRGWTEEYAKEYERKAIPAGAPTPPEAIADFVAFLLKNKERHKFMTGAIIPYGV